MKETRTKLAAVILTAALLPGLAACDGGTSTETDGEEGTDPAPGTVETQRPEEG